MAGPTVVATTGWLTAAEELAAFEGIRLGDEDAFRTLAEPLQPVLRRLAAVYVGDDRVDAVVRRGWLVALRGDEMFRWQTPLATWVAAITAGCGRAERRRVPAAPHTEVPAIVTPRPGPDDWADLPWSERWQGVGQTFHAAFAALPLAEREVLYGRDVAGWPPRRVCEVFAVPEAAYAKHLASARHRVHTAVAAHVGLPDAGADRDVQVSAIGRWLAERPPPQPEPFDPGTLAVFRRWAAGREPRWSRIVRRVSRRSVAPAGRRDGRGSGTASDRPTPT